MVLSMVKKPNSATGGHSNAHTPRPVMRSPRTMILASPSGSSGRRSM